MTEKDKDNLVEELIQESMNKKEMKDFVASWREYSEDAPTLTHEQEMKQLKEYFYSFLPMIDLTQKTMQVTRAPNLPVEEVLDAWVDYDAKTYDEFYSTDNMSYHVLLPTRELCRSMGVDPELSYPGGHPERIRRKRKVIKDGDIYQAIVIALGKNRRAAITWGLKDLVAAYDAGLKQVPVVFEYHRVV
jgi:hypothetical protein